MISRNLIAALSILVLASMATAHGRFAHPGCLSTQADLKRMAEKVAADEQPWKASWDILVENTNGFLDDEPLVQEKISVGGGLRENYIRMARDCAKAYQCALRYHGSGDKRFADKAIEILNAWASTHKEWGGDSNVQLRSGLYGYQFACTAELMRIYNRWNRSDLRKFQTYMLKQFYPANSDFLVRHNGTVDSHYWANWDLAAMASIMAIGVLCDDTKIFKEGMDYFYKGIGNGAIGNAVVFVHPDGLGQWQESGRDQGHSLMGPQLMGVICEIAWNQGVDLYGHMDNRLLAGVEYVSKYNLDHEVPYVAYVREWAHPGKEKHDINARISPHARGAVRPGWDLLYNHYVNRRGMAAPFTQAYAEKARPEGGGFNFGGSSGGFDSLGFTTLTHSRDPIAKGAVPGALRPVVRGRQITLSWAGSAYAKSYNVKRSTRKGGPYTAIATVIAPNLHHTDTGLTAGTPYYYVVSANHADGESANSAEVAAATDGQLHGTVIGTDGTFQDSGADKYTVFDGSLTNYFDPSAEEAWAGLDLGPGVSAVITELKYCPRKGFASRMVGGKFQGSNSADFNSGVVDLYTVRSQPKQGVLTSQSIRESTAFRYLRFIAASDSGSCNVAEIQFIGEVSGLNAPAPPDGLTATPVDESEIGLSWNPVSGANSYHIKRITPAGGPDLIIKNLSETTYRDTDLQPGFAYHYVVTALNSAGESMNSTPVSIRTESSDPEASSDGDD